MMIKEQSFKEFIDYFKYGCNDDFFEDDLQLQYKLNIKILKNLISIEIKNKLSLNSIKLIDKPLNKIVKKETLNFLNLKYKLFKVYEKHYLYHYINIQENVYYRSGKFFVKDKFYTILSKFIIDDILKNNQNVKDKDIILYLDIGDIECVDLPQAWNLNYGYYFTIKYNYLIRNDYEK